MMTRRSRNRSIVWILVSGIFLVSTGCFFNLSEEKDFKSWYFGAPGMAGALGEERCDAYADRIQGERHPYYLHFRTLEIFYQPQGGAHYPERSTVTALDTEAGRTTYACEIVEEGRETFNFNAVDAGLVDVMVPFRKVTAVEEAPPSAAGSYAGSVASNAGIAAVMKTPVYLVHDVLKTLYLPVAGTYFMFRSDDGAADEIDTADREADAVAADTTEESRAAPDQTEASADELAGPQTQSPPPAATSSAAPTAESIPEEVEAVPPPEPLSRAAADEDATQSAEVLSAPAPTASSVAADTAAGRMGTASGSSLDGSATAAEAGGRAIQEEDLSDGSEAVATAAETVKPGTETPLVATARPNETQEAQPLKAEEETAASTEAIAAPDETVDMASVSASREALADAAPSMPVIEAVDVSSSDLIKQVAFLGFVSRAATVEPQTKDLFEQTLWPVVSEECGRSVRMVREGEPQFPQALTGLSRDQFGRLNSFEVTTLSRLAGINAVVTGSVIDVRLSNEISGVLWYKQPEGTLRVAILVEVYDAETGTKLLDKTLVREMEVEELEPGSEARLRQQDMPFLREALDAIAEEMSEMVCDVIEDQPWRGFVTAIDGSRVTLSSGAAAGLIPGQILSVYNSQIIEGLNNQQFFLTGEKVGRVQITRVFPDHAEAYLLEGADHIKTYSLVLPER
jgi:hypothetical protein